MNKFWKVLGSILGVIILIALITALVFWIIALAKNMSFVDFVKSIFEKKDTAKACIEILPYNPINFIIR